jgi:hypothetical protein
MNLDNENEKKKYLRIIGRLYPDNRLELRPSYLTYDSRGSEEDLDSPLVAKLYNKEGELLLRYHLSAIPYLAVDRIIPELAVRGRIPFPQATSLIRFYRDDVMLHEIKVSEEKPRVKLTWETPKHVSGKQTITWEGHHPDNQPLQYFLRYTHTNGENWQRIGWRTEEMQQEIDFDQLPGGKDCRVSIVTTDGVNTATDMSISFQVDIKGCIAMIFSPQDGATFAQESPILLEGQGFYMEENKAEIEALVWTSSRDRELGRGTLVQTRKLSSGRHDITLVAGTGRRAGKATVSIHISSNSPSKARRDHKRK